MKFTKDELEGIDAGYLPKLKKEQAIISQAMATKYGVRANNTITFSSEEARRLYEENKKQMHAEINEKLNKWKNVNELDLYGGVTRGDAYRKIEVIEKQENVNPEFNAQNKAYTIVNKTIENEQKVKVPLTQQQVEELEGSLTNDFKNTENIEQSKITEYINHRERLQQRYKEMRRNKLKVNARDRKKNIER